MTGIEAVTPTAAISPHRMPLLVEKPAAATGVVWMSRLVRIRANRNSFQPPMKLRIATATRPGAATGTRQNRPHCEQPSISAASSISRGTSRKKPTMIQATSGVMYTGHTRIRAQ